MKQQTVLWVVCLLVCSTAAGVSLWPAVGHGQMSSSPVASQTAESASGLQVKFNPERNSINASKPAAFAVLLYNPPRNDPTSVFLEIGASDTDGSLVMEVADEKPWYKHNDKTWWARQVVLAPGELEPIGVVVFPGSKAGEYELNATASYVLDGNYTKQSNVAMLEIDSNVVTTTPLNGTHGILELIQDWLQENWQWLFALLSLFVAILSFFEYERVRGKIEVWNSRPGGEDTSSERDTDHKS